MKTFGTLPPWNNEIVYREIGRLTRNRKCCLQRSFAPQNGFGSGDAETFARFLTRLGRARTEIYNDSLRIPHEQIVMGIDCGARNSIDNLRAPE